MTDAPAPPPGLPEPLLGPLLETAGEVLRRLPQEEVPALARRLATFDRRGLSTPAARAQLRRLLESEDGFRDRTVEAFLERPEVASLEAGWEPTQAARQVEEAAAGGGLPLLASALWARRPPGYEFGLGLAVAAFDSAQDEAGLESRLRSAEARVASVEEARRRAEEARLAAQGEAGRLEAELRDERRARRSREEETAGQLEDARRRVSELEAALVEAQSQREAAEAGAGQAGERAERAEAGERAARAELVEMRSAAASVASEPAAERAALAEAAEAAARLAAALRGLVEEGGRASSPAPAPADLPAGPLPADRSREARRAPVYFGGHPRAPVRVPPGMRDDTVEAAQTMVRTPGVVVVVDGYNVSMLAWPGTRPAEQRERLCDALAELHLRARCQVTVVFDGAEVPGVRPQKRPGLHIVFSAPGQEADEVVVNEVASRPPAIPVLVVSSDAWVRSRAEAQGAQVLPSAVFLDLLRR